MCSLLYQLKGSQHCLSHSINTKTNEEYFEVAGIFSVKAISDIAWVVLLIYTAAKNETPTIASDNGILSIWLGLELLFSPLNEHCPDEFISPGQLTICLVRNRAVSLQQRMTVPGQWSDWGSYSASFVVGLPPDKRLAKTVLWLLDVGCLYVGENTLEEIWEESKDI